MENKRFTIKDIAKLADVSIGTVDRVLHNRGRVSETTAERIRNIIKETGFTPNLQASRLSQSRDMHIAAILPHEYQDNGFWVDSHRGIRDGELEFQSMGMTVETFSFDRNNPEDFISISKPVIEGDFDALLLAAVLPDRARMLLQNCTPDMPFILFDTPLPGHKPLSFIGQDAFSAGQTAAHLLSLGAVDSKKLACIQANPSDYHIIQRARGFMNFFDEGASPTVLPFHAREKMDPSECLDMLSDSITEPDGLYLTNALVGMLAGEARKRWPNVRIVGHDLTAANTELLRNGDIDFLLSQHPADQTREALRLIWRHLSLRENPPSNIFMPVEIVTLQNLGFSTDRS